MSCSLCGKPGNFGPIEACIECAIPRVKVTCVKCRKLRAPPHTSVCWTCSKDDPQLRGKMRQVMDHIRKFEREVLP